MMFSFISLVVQTAQVLGVATPATAAVEDGCDFKWMTQSVDHFGHGNATFQQRYSISTEHFRPGGPILFFQGEESAVLDCVDTTAAMWFAEHLGGMAVSLEHRYFGQSLPFGNDSYTNENFGLLTLDNVMADAVAFIEMVQATIPGAQNSKCIVMSGSYGGFLVTAFRQNHPDTFFASLAAAGPTIGLSAASATPQPDQFLVREYASRSYTDRSEKASERIKNALDLIQHEIESGNTKEIQQNLGLCNTPPSNPVSIIALQQLYSGAFTSAVEYNYAAARPGRIPVARSFDRIIDIALHAKSPMEILNNSLWLWYEDQDYECIDWTNSTFVQHLVPLIQWTPWSYITCTYVPLCGTATPEGTIFPPFQGACLQQKTNCAQTYNASLLTQQEVWDRYRLGPEALNNSTHIIFSVGEFDPTTAVVGAHPPLTGDICRSRRIYTSGMAHREDLFYPTVDDKPEVIRLRNKELQIMKQWLASCD